MQKEQNYIFHPIILKIKDMNDMASIAPLPSPLPPLPFQYRCWGYTISTTSFIINLCLSWFY